MTGDHFGYGNPGRDFGPGPGHAARIFTWPAGQEPPLDDIGVAVALLSGGTVRMRPADAGEGLRALVVADHDVSAAEAERLLYGGQS
jgi:hypothetical protein